MLPSCLANMQSLTLLAQRTSQLKFWVEPYLSLAGPPQRQNTVCQPGRHSPASAQGVREMAGACRAVLVPACSP